MIDLSIDAVFTLSEAPAHLPRRSEGRKVHQATVFRWAKTGVRGVRLETIRVGGSLCTSAAAIQRFCEKLGEVRDGKKSSLDFPAKPNGSAERAVRELERVGI